MKHELKKLGIALVMVLAMFGIAWGFPFSDCEKNPENCEEIIHVTDMTTGVTSLISEKTLHAIIILDESGSMEDMRQEAIDVFNNQVGILEKRAKEINIKLTLVKFATVPETIFWDADINPASGPFEATKVTRLSKDNYDPDGSTAMLDAVGRTLSKFRYCSAVDLKDENTTFLMILISDGLENNSKEFGWNDVAELVERVNENKRWKFVYLGSNLDLARIRDTFSMGDGDFLIFNTDSAGAWRATDGSLGTATDSFIGDSAIGDADIDADFFEKKEEPK